jgi:hypothetical protein
METTTSLIRAFKQDAPLFAPLPNGGAIYKIDFGGLTLPPDTNLEDFRLFVSGEWAAGYGGTTYCHTYFARGNWYLYNALLYHACRVNIIAVPKSVTMEEGYSNAIFEHVANDDNTGIPDFDKVTDPLKYPYTTWIDDERLNGNDKLMLIVSRHEQYRLNDPYPGAHHHAVWYDARKEGKNGVRGVWAIVQPGRFAIPPDSRFNVMSMTPYVRRPVDCSKKPPLAFAFEHQVNLGVAPHTSPNTTPLKKERAEYLIKKRIEWKEACPKNPVAVPPVKDLIVVATERIEDMATDGVWKTADKINDVCLNVWYVDPKVPINEQTPNPNDLWTVFAGGSDIKPIRVNICTRMPCPPDCR